MIAFRSDVRPSLDAVIALYRAAPLYRPIDDLDRMRRMYAGSNVLPAAWDGDRLVGVLRGLTDGAYTTYVCDLAIDPAYQRRGIGRELLARVTALHPETGVVLQASQMARDYYRHLGWQKIENGWQHPRPHWDLSAQYAQRERAGGG